MSGKVFFVTGVSTGFGRAIAEEALAKGHVVVGTLRKEEERAAFDQLSPGRSHGVVLDVTDNAAIPGVVARVEKEVGPIDVLINNAGYGHEGLIEESSVDDLRRQFEVNVFGAVAMIHAVLPSMRRRRTGRILNITSMGGLTTFAGLGFYHGSKFALEGISETLGKEVKDFGIQVTAVAPGGFRTDWAGRSMVRAPRSIADYDALMNPIRERRLQMSGRQIGDPRKGAAAIVALATAEKPPAHVLLGSDAWRLVHEKLDALQAEYEAWKSTSLSTDVTESK
jgi:NAD(P)-dependent dehydrogenase (short-subunit alcohol dehydrogenase family)